MKRKRDDWAIIIVLPVIIAVCVMLWFFRTHYIYTVVDYLRIYSVGGEWDFTDVNFDEDVIIRMNGDVEYVPDALLDPVEFDAAPNKAVGEPADVTNVSTSRQRIIVPDGTYMMMMVSIDFSDKIYINGELRATVGQPGEDREDSEPGFAYMYFEVRPVNGVIEIVRQGSNFVHEDTGSHGGIKFGRPDMMRRLIAFENDMASVIMGIFLSLFIVHITLYLIFRSYRANLFFALFCLTWLFRTGFTGVKPLLSLFPGIGWYAAFRTEYISIPLAGLFLILVIREMLPGTISKWFVYVMGAESFTFAALCVLIDTRTLSRALIYHEIIALAGIFYVVMRVAVRVPGMVRRGELNMEKFICILGLTVFFYGTVNDILYHTGIYLFNIAYSMSDVALLIFAFCQMTAMFKGTLRESLEARDKEQALSDENAALNRVNRLKDDMMATISHEMSTPLAVMAGYAQLMVRERKARGVDDQTSEDLDGIYSEAMRLATLAGELQDLSRARESGQERRPVSLSDMVRQMSRMYDPIFQRSGTSQKLEIEADALMVYGNVDELTQVMLNLLSNAGKHAAGGTVEVHVARADGEIVFSVKDDGEGMSPELISRAFDRYVHGDEDGLGLGLAICREIIESHGGSMSLESELGVGTEVAFSLPEYEGNE